MPIPPPAISRRDFFASLVPGQRQGVLDRAFLKPPPAAAPAPAPEVETTAIIAGRFCLAYQGTFCSTCRERCPVPGAIIVERGMPQVIADKCNGCRICHEVCPAPTNAIRLVPRPAAKPTSPASC